MRRAVVVQPEARPADQPGDGGSIPTPPLHLGGATSLVLPHLTGREWRVLPLPSHKEAARVVKAQHYSRGTANTSTARFGLYRADCLFGDPFGVSLWMPPTRTAAEAIAGDDWGGVLVLSRLVVEEGVPTNGASFLLAWSRRQIDRERWPVLVTYADTAMGHTGAIYLADNWTCDGPVVAGDVWIDPDGRRMGRKRGGRNFTAAEMRGAGFVRVPAAPKIRFRHELVNRHPAKGQR